MSAQHLRTLEGNSLSNIPDSQEQAMRISGMRSDTADAHDQAMYREAAKQVSYNNC